MAEPESEPQAPTRVAAGPEIPEGAKPGDVLSVFVYLDSEDRPIATTRTPEAGAGRGRVLARDRGTQFGAFVDWGLPKELLVPFASRRASSTSERAKPIGLYLDDSGRLAGTMRVTEMLRARRRDFEQDEWVRARRGAEEPEIGLFVIVERSVVGLVPAHEPHWLVARRRRAISRHATCCPTASSSCRSAASLTKSSGDDASESSTVLARPRPPRVGDKSSPDEIRDAVRPEQEGLQARGRAAAQGAAGGNRRARPRALGAGGTGRKKRRPESSRHEALISVAHVGLGLAQDAAVIEPEHQQRRRQDRQHHRLQ